MATTVRDGAVLAGRIASGTGTVLSVLAVEHMRRIRHGGMHAAHNATINAQAAEQAAVQAGPAQPQ